MWGEKRGNKRNCRFKAPLDVNISEKTDREGAMKKQCVRESECPGYIANHFSSSAAHLASISMQLPLAPALFPSLPPSLPPLFSLCKPSQPPHLLCFLTIPL